MIKVERIEKPEELTVDVQKHLTEEFKKDKVCQSSSARKLFLRDELEGFGTVGSNVQCRRKEKWILACSR